MSGFPITRRALCVWGLCAFAVASCSSSPPTDPDTRAPFVGWLVPVVTAGDTVFVFMEDTTTVAFTAGDDGGIISRVQVYLDGVLATTLTSTPYQTQLSLSGIGANRSVRVWATATDPTGKTGSTADTLRFVRSVRSDTATWTQLAPTRSPLARDGFTWDVEVSASRALLFGGYPSATFTTMSDLWSYDLATDQWDSLATLGPTPHSRTMHGAGVVSGRLVVAGGEHMESGADSVLEDYAVLDLASLNWNSDFDIVWRPTMAMAAAVSGTGVYFYGGVSVPTAAVHDSLRVYDVVTDQWQLVSTMGQEPGGRALALLAVMPDDGELFLFGGTRFMLPDPPADAKGYRLDLGNRSWTGDTAQGPPALAEGAAIYDSTSHRIVLWGGRDGTGGYPVEVWEYSLGTYSWRQLPVVGTPPAGRAGHRVVYDAPRRRLLMFGGRSGATFYNETWELRW